MSYPRAALDGLPGIAPLLAACADPPRATRSVLRARLGARTAFAREHGLGPDAPPDALRAAVPARTFAELRPWLDRVLDGEPDVLFPGRPAYLARTTGTTGEPKLLPVSRGGLAAFREVQRWWGAALIRDLPASGRGRWLSLVHSGRSDRRGDLDVGNVAAFGVAHDGAGDGRVVDLPARTLDERLRLAPRFAAKGRWTLLGAPVPSVTVGVLTAVRDGGEALCDEVAAEDPARGGELRRILERHGRLDPRAIWPDLVAVAAWRAGPSVRWRERLADLVGDLPIREVGWCASEGHFALAAWPDADGGLLAAHRYAFELAPLGSSDVVWPEEVDVGQRCRVVVTTPELVRYDTEDVVDVVGRVGRLPVVAFAYRDGAAGIAGERVSEPQLADALAEALGREAPDFRAQPMWGAPPYWRIAVPAPTEGLGPALDRALRARNVGYDRRRADGGLGPPRIEAWSGPGRVDKGERLIRTPG